MTTNRASDDPNSSRRLVMVVGGFFLALVAAVIASIGIAEVWFTDAPAAAFSVAAETASARPWEPLAMIVLGGIGFAAGASLVGIGMGRWTAPRPAESEADYTGPGHLEDTPQPPQVV
jgi:hypothetical protein